MPPSSRDDSGQLANIKTSMHQNNKTINIKITNTLKRWAGEEHEPHGETRGSSLTK